MSNQDCSLIENDLRVSLKGDLLCVYSQVYEFNFAF